MTSFIGPSSHHISLMGDKIAAKSAMDAAGLPTVPGSSAPIEASMLARVYIFGS